MKFPTLFFITFLLSGCISSSYLASVGAKAKHGSVALDGNSQLKIPLINSERNVGTWAMMHGLILPYTNLYPDKDGNEIAEVSFNIDDIQWSSPNSNTGKIQLEIRGERLEFVVTKDTDRLQLIHEYRDWDGYPLQALLVITMPLDIVIGTAGGVSMLIVAPFAVE